MPAHYVYLLTNKNNTVLYTGTTADLKYRIYQHKHENHTNSFTAKYNVNKLVYYECKHSIKEARERERQIKGWSRTKKNRLIATVNPNWNDLSIGSTTGRWKLSRYSL